MIGPQKCHLRIPALVQNRNEHWRGWANYFSLGYPRVAFREINTYVRERLKRHLRPCSQRPFRLPEGQTYYQHFGKLGLLCL
jgi:hypothetical protein